MQFENTFRGLLLGGHALPQRGKDQTLRCGVAASKVPSGKGTSW
jgi:hypothetical protein